MPGSTDSRNARFASAVARDLGALHRLALSYEADPGRAEDLVQEILLAFWQALDRFRGEASLRTYLFRVAHNRALRHVARRRARRPVERSAGEAAEAEPGDDSSPEEVTLESESRRRLRAAVRGLRESLRQVVVLRLEGLNAREIGDVLDLTSNNVTVRLHRARIELRKALDGAGGARGQQDRHDV